MKTPKNKPPSTPKTNNRGGGKVPHVNNVPRSTPVSRGNISRKDQSGGIETK